MHEQSNQELKTVGDALLEKARIYVQQLEPEQMSPQALKQLSGFLKDLRELGREKEEPGQEILVRFLGGEESWRN